MNCKEGDLAIVVKSKSGNEGKVVRCLKFVGKALLPDGRQAAGDCYWEVDVDMNFSPANVFAMYALDSQLMPIRDESGEDETLTWAGKPNNLGFLLGEGGAFG